MSRMDWTRRFLEPQSVKWRVAALQGKLLSCFNSSHNYDAAVAISIAVVNEISIWNTGLKDGFVNFMAALLVYMFNVIFFSCSMAEICGALPFPGELDDIKLQLRRFISLFLAL
jgi:hypothetical protein